MPSQVLILAHHPARQVALHMPVKLALQMVWRHQRRGTAAFALALGVAGLGADTGQSHQAMNAIDTALFTQFAQVIADLAVTVHAAAFQP